MGRRAGMATVYRRMLDKVAHSAGSTHACGVHSVKSNVGYGEVLGKENTTCSLKFDSMFSSDSMRTWQTLRYSTVSQHQGRFAPPFCTRTSRQP